ncbi:hypothetical protein F4810DRAFT_658514 [Camillea tinctor]|nr:hypothetical protein F4810DRAFT_658514 [Camillea tinctor]
MTKVIRQGEAEGRARLENRKRLLENEIKRLDALLKREHHNVEKKDQGPESPVNGTEPSYLRPTNASRNRFAQDNQSEDKTKDNVILIHGAPYTFKDGRLVGRSLCYDRKCRSSNKISQYQIHTRASAYKVKPLIRWERSRYNSSTPDSPVSPNDELDMDDPTLLPESDSQTLEEPEPVVEDSNNLESTSISDLEALEDEYRKINDMIPNDFYEFLSLPSKVSYRILYRALRIAQEVFYNATREHWPDIFKHMCPTGPHEVRFEYKKLKNLGVYDWIQLRVPGAESRSPINYKFQEITVLRNDVCHFSQYHGIQSIFRDISHVYHVFSFALDANDKARARKALALRREIHMEVKKILDDFENLEPLALLPFAHPWKEHHLAAIKLCFRIRDFEFEQQVPCLQRIAKHYGSVNPDAFPKGSHYVVPTRSEQLQGTDAVW